MNNYFIGWSGNQALAYEVAALVESNESNHAIVGGGLPKDMYIGAQVIRQIQQCNYAILLVEDKNGAISPNLMFEWGYLMATLPFKNIYAFLINKHAHELPSDLQGTWVFELKRDSDDDKALANSIFEILQKNSHVQDETNYFDLINNWYQIFSRISEKKAMPDETLCQYLLAGCLSAYYYMGYQNLRHELNEIPVKNESTSIISFVKSYIDLFLESGNMMHPLSENNFFRLMQNFDTTLNRNKVFDENIELLVDILCYDAYGLTCALFLQNEDLDDSAVDFCTKKALELFAKDIELIDQFEAKYQSNKCLVYLIRSYIYNDLAHLYKNRIGDFEKYKSYLDISVESRKLLYQSFVALYNNSFLAVKLEQEYIIALSEQTIYMEDSFTKKMNQNTIRTKVTEWEKELLFASSLTERIKNSIKKF